MFGGNKKKPLWHCRETNLRFYSTLMATHCPFQPLFIVPTSPLSFWAPPRTLLICRSLFLLMLCVCAIFTSYASKRIETGRIVCASTHSVHSIFLATVFLSTFFIVNKFSSGKPCQDRRVIRLSILSPQNNPEAFCRKYQNCPIFNARYKQLSLEERNSAMSGMWILMFSWKMPHKRPK